MSRKPGALCCFDSAAAIVSGCFAGDAAAGAAVPELAALPHAGFGIPEPSGLLP
eukprot:COSAG06_NODE_25726_length_630_cov_0.768362_2_plen_53_part_01